ncbi:hypothetical protein M8J77_019610 [Diaphorina citri]|nr:hypothetical protein M8J77_019610 [Diaphorina citri]
MKNIGGAPDLVTIPKELQALPDRIAKTYENKSIFLSGGSGFLGKVLIEKILRLEPNVKKIYLLMRTKKGKTPNQRVEELFESPVFDALKTLRGKSILQKIQVISGDITQLKLGISEIDKKELIDNVDIVYHVAATIRFDEPIKTAVILNTRGTRDMLELSKQMKNLKCFTYISTAYCHPSEKVLEERTYLPPDDPHQVILRAESMKEEDLEVFRQDILGEFPNSYAYTKCLAEGLVAECMELGMPCMILRPSIVVPIYKEPLPGWTDNINGPTGLLIGAGKGVIRSMYCKNTGMADFLPADVAINGVFLFTWDFLNSKESERKSVCNLTSNKDYKITWQEICDIGKDIVTSKIPFNSTLWYPGGTMTQSRLTHFICCLLFHWIPAYFLDAVILISGNKPCLVRIQERIHRGFDVFEYYANNEWEFKNGNLHQTRPKRNAREIVQYCVENDNVDIVKYFEKAVYGARYFLMKESPESLESARKKMKVIRFYYQQSYDRLVVLDSASVKVHLELHSLIPPKI